MITYNHFNLPFYLYGCYNKANEKNLFASVYLLSDADCNSELRSLYVCIALASIEF